MSRNRVAARIAGEELTLYVSYQLIPREQSNRSNLNSLKCLDSFQRQTHGQRIAIGHPRQTAPNCDSGVLGWAWILPG